MNKTVIVTGGAGFIGSEVVRYLIKTTDYTVVNLDKLTYAANLDSLSSVAESERYQLEVADICDRARMEEIITKYQPERIMHLAAETHVDRSIDGPADFVQTNIVGTYTLLEATLAYYNGLSDSDKSVFRFLHISTDEVYGSLNETDMFHEDHQYQPNSPYSASKASSDHLVRAWTETYKLPALITNCTNNYGGFQFPEKLIPVVILKILSNQSIPVYGSGTNVRDWLHVSDHAIALWEVISRGKIGETYCVGGECEKNNIQVVSAICEIMDELRPSESGKSYTDLITFVEDRPGHDQRYAMDISKIRRELGWSPAQTFESGIRNTVEWYLDNKDWWQKILDNKYDGERLGTKRA